MEDATYGPLCTVCTPCVSKSPEKYDTIEADLYSPDELCAPGLLSTTCRTHIGGLKWFSRGLRLDILFATVSVAKQISN